MRIQMKNKAIAWRAEKRKWLGREKKKKKICFSSSAIKDIQQTPVTPTTFSSPKILYTKKHLKKKFIFRNISPVKRKVEYSLNTLWVLHMMS